MQLKNCLKNALDLNRCSSDLGELSSLVMMMHEQLTTEANAETWLRMKRHSFDLCLLFVLRYVTAGTPEPLITTLFSKNMMWQRGCRRVFVITIIAKLTGFGPLDISFHLSRFDCVPPKALNGIRI